MGLGIKLMDPETAVEDKHDSDRQEQRGSDLGRRGGNDRRTGKEGAAGFDEFDEQAARDDRHLEDLTSGPRPHHQLEIHFLCNQMCSGDGSRAFLLLPLHLPLLLFLPVLRLRHSLPSFASMDSITSMQSTDRLSQQSASSHVPSCISLTWNLPQRPSSWITMIPVIVRKNPVSEWTVLRVAGNPSVESFCGSDQLVQLGLLGTPAAPLLWLQLELLFALSGPRRQVVRLVSSVLRSTWVLSLSALGRVGKMQRKSIS